MEKRATRDGHPSDRGYVGFGIGRVRVFNLRTPYADSERVVTPRSAELVRWVDVTGGKSPDAPAEVLRFLVQRWTTSNRSSISFTISITEARPASRRSNCAQPG